MHAGSAVTTGVNGAGVCLGTGTPTHSPGLPPPTHLLCGHDHLFPPCTQLLLHPPAHRNLDTHREHFLKLLQPESKL